MDLESKKDCSLSVSSSCSRRLSACIVGLVSVVIVATAYWLSPSPTGLGTHRQLGLPRCGWIVTADIPCPTCGMTTAFSYTVRGQIFLALKTQPFGTFLALCVVVTGIFAFAMAITGRPDPTHLYRLMTTKTLFIFAGVAALAWGYKILAHRGWFS